MTPTQAMELWLGPSHNGSSFESDEHRREVWFRYRDRLMQQWGRHGRRPQAWWQHESSQFGLHRYPTFQYERSVLWETPGVLTEAERAELEEQWRREWDRVWDEPNFFRGDEARVHHLVWADVPPELVYKWLAERERALAA